MGCAARALLGLVVSLGAVAGAGGGLTVDEGARTVRVRAAVAKQGTYDVLKGAIEYVLVSKGGKEYESAFLTECPPADIHGALQKIGLVAGEPAKEGRLPRGPDVRILVEYEADGKPARRPVEDFLQYLKTGKPVEPGPWTYTGSTGTYDPEAQRHVLQAKVTKSIVGLHYSDPSPLFQNPRPEARQENLYKANAQRLPKPGTPVTVVFERVVRQLPAGTTRVHAFVSGRVQGVGFRAFTQREARQRNLAGWVKNLADGRVEAVIEGPKAQADALLAKMRRGPRAARVDKLETANEEPQGDLQGFEIRY